MKEKIDVFLSRYSLSTHSLVVFCTAMVTMYFEVPQVHDYVYGTFTHLPPGIKNFISVAIIAIGWYWRGKKVWTPLERAEKTTTVVPSAPPGTSAGGDNAPVEVAVAQSTIAPVVVPAAATTAPEATAPVPAPPSSPVKPSPPSGW